MRTNFGCMYRLAPYGTPLSDSYFVVGRGLLATNDGKEGTRSRHEQGKCGKYAGHGYGLGTGAEGPAGGRSEVGERNCPLC